jgi:hypothetical protein
MPFIQMRESRIIQKTHNFSFLGNRDAYEVHLFSSINLEPMEWMSCNSDVAVLQLDITELCYSLPKILKYNS